MINASSALNRNIKRYNFFSEIKKIYIHIHTLLDSNRQDVNISTHEIITTNQYEIIINGYTKSYNSLKIKLNKIFHPEK